MKNVKPMIKELQAALGGISSCLKTRAQDWDESKHKRASNGQFGSGSGANKAGGEKKASAPMTREQKREKMYELNEKMEQADKAIREAEFAGLRGEAMIKVKRELRLLQEQHKKIRATLD